MNVNRERGVIQRVRRSLAQRPAELVTSNKPAGSSVSVVAGYSGGADSLALVVVLRELERLGLVRLVAVHVDHGVRDESARDAETAANVATNLGVAFRGCRIDPEALASHRGVGLEESMRRERYRLLAATATEIGATMIATGHHQRDQAETVLLHLMRGTGLHGAGGMRAWTPLAVPWWGGEVVNHLLLWRPLLDESPASLRDMVESMGLPIVEDVTNRDEDVRRNAVRHRILPLLESIAPGAEANIAAFAPRAAEDDVALQAVAEACLGTPTAQLDRTILLGQPLVIQRRMVRQWIATLAPDVELSAERTEAVLILAGRNSGGKALEIGAGWLITMRGGMLVLMPGSRPS